MFDSNSTSYDDAIAPCLSRVFMYMFMALFITTLTSLAVFSSTLFMSLIWVTKQL